MPDLTSIPLVSGNEDSLRRQIGPGQLLTRRILLNFLKASDSGDEYRGRQRCWICPAVFASCGGVAQLVRAAES